MKSSSSASGIALVLCAAALWGTTGTAQTFVSPGLSPLWFGALRLGVAALAFTLFFVATNVINTTTPRQYSIKLLLFTGFGAGLSMAAYNLAFFAGVKAVGVALGTVIAIGSGPVWAGVLQLLLTRKLPKAGWWAGTALAVAGGALMALQGQAAGASGGSAPALSASGVALCLCAGLSYAAYTLFCQRALAPSKGVAIPTATLTSFAFTVAAAVALPWAWYGAGTPALNTTDIAAALFVGLAATALAYALYAKALQHINAATAVTLALGEPVTAFVLAILVVGESPTALAAAGLGLVVLGVWVTAWSELRRA